MAGYIGTQPVPQATQTRDAFTCTAGQTSFATSGYTPGFLDVYLNGIKLAAADYTASNGSDVVLASGAALDDILEVVAYTSFEVVTDTVTNAGTVLNLDRTGSDGTILDLKKDGTTVGSIASRAGVVSTFILDPRTSSGTGVGITGANQNTIMPTDAGGNLEDAAIDLGDGFTRFKDLYLSGGVYLGGTGSANKLDDYEEGTWTPVYYSDTDNPTSTYDGITGGRYTKTGNIVVASCLIKTDSVSGGSGNLKVNGLPFTSRLSGNFNVGNGIIGEFAAFGGDFPSHARVLQNSTFAAIMYRTSVNGAESAMQISDLATGANSNTLAVTFIYEAA